MLPDELKEDCAPGIPMFSSWKHWYVIVIAFLALLIILFTWLTISFS
jgi:hypothetical protein